jgi:hypothetical protein
MHALWLVPDRTLPVYSQLSQCISDLAAFRSTPTFDPHVTLLGSIQCGAKEAGKRSAELASASKPVRIELTGIDTGETYHKALYFVAEQSEAMLEANFLASSAFGINKKDYSPHLSLAYGHFPEADLAELKQIVLGDYGFLIGMGFVAHAIELWRCEGRVEEWQRVQAYSLGDGGNPS